MTSPSPSRRFFPPLLLAATIFLLATCLAVSLRADPAPAHLRWMGHGDLVARYNPEGVMAVAGALLRRTYAWDANGGYESSYLQAGFSGGVNPAYAQGSIHTEALPTAWLQLRVQADLYGYFGVNGALLSFDSGQQPFGAKDISARKGSEETATGRRLLIQPTLRAKIGRLVARSQLDLGWYGFSGSGPWFYEWEYDTLLRTDDLLVSWRTQSLLQAWRGRGDETLLLGLVYEITQATEAEISRQRLGMQGYWVAANRWGWMARPRMFGQAGVNLRDTHRSKQMWMAIGVGFDIE